MKSTLEPTLRDEELNTGRNPILNPMNSDRTSPKAGGKVHALLSKTSASFDKSEAKSRALQNAFGTQNQPTGFAAFDPNKKSEADLPQPSDLKSSLNKKIRFMRDVRQVSQNIQDLMSENLQQTMK